MNSLPPIPWWWITQRNGEGRYCVLRFARRRWERVGDRDGCWSMAAAKAVARSVKTGVPVVILDHQRWLRPIAWTNTAAHGTVLEGDA